MTRRERLLVEEAAALLRAVPADAMPHDWSVACGRWLDELERLELTSRPRSRPVEDHGRPGAGEIPSGALVQHFARHPTPEMRAKARNGGTA